MVIMKNLVTMIINEDIKIPVILVMLLVLMHNTEAIREIIKEVVETGVKVLDLMISITLKLLETLSQIGILPNQPVSFVSKLGILQMSAGYLLNSWLLVFIDHHQIGIRGQHI